MAAAPAETCYSDFEVLRWIWGRGCADAGEEGLDEGSDGTNSSEVEPREDYHYCLYDPLVVVSFGWLLRVYLRGRRRGNLQLVYKLMS